MVRFLDRFEEFQTLGIKMDALNAGSKCSSTLLDLFENEFLRVDIVHFHDGRLWEVRVFSCYPNGDYSSEPRIVTTGLTIEETLECLIHPTSVSSATIPSSMETAT
jgi:hypothetical protein